MSSEKASVNCGVALTIAHAAGLHKELSQALEESTTIEIVADSVEKVDTAGLQIFVSLVHELEKVSGKIIWQKPSSVLLQAINTLGLTAYVSIDTHLSNTSNA